MEFLFFFSLAGVIIVSLILKFDKKQAVKVNAVLKESRSVPPLFMLKSTEQKISILKTALRYDDVPQNMGAAASLSNIYSTQSESSRLSKVQELKLLSSKYNNGLAQTLAVLHIWVRLANSCLIFIMPVKSMVNRESFCWIYLVLASIIGTRK